eukprot:3564238-Pleurochrysis_carterae.AAC.6
MLGRRSVGKAGVKRAAKLPNSAEGAAGCWDGGKMADTVLERAALTQRRQRAERGALKTHEQQTRSSASDRST